MKTNNVSATTAPILLIYGPEGYGKTTLSSKFPKPVMIATERGIPRGISMDVIENTDSFEGILAAARELYSDPGGYQTLIVDTLDALEPYLQEHVCAENGWKNIESPGFGKGYAILDNTWRRFLRAMTAIRDQHGMTIVLVCHAGIERIDDPRAPSYTAYAPRLHKRAKALVMDACDAVFFLADDLRIVTDDRERTRASSGRGRFLFTEGRPAFAAKNRFGMPEKIPLPADLPITELTKHWS
jgi:AAA domain